MTSQGTASGRFTRAIRRGHLFAAEMAAREMGSLSISDALALCLLYQAEQDPRFGRAFQRWLRRTQVEHRLTRSQVDLLRAAGGSLGGPFAELGRNVLTEACRTLRLPAPTLLE